MVTLEQAKEHLNAWLEADSALSTGKEYRIGTRSLTRADASEVKERITYWSQQVSQLSSRRKSRSRRVVLLD